MPTSRNRCCNRKLNFSSKSTVLIAVLQGFYLLTLALLSSNKTYESLKTREALNQIKADFPFSITEKAISINACISSSLAHSKP
jgi:hypothetical protein